jgi:hypothetical protein
MREEVDGTDDHRQSGEYMNNMSAGRPANHPPTTHPPLVCCCSPSRHASRQVWDWCEAEWEAAEAGRYKESARSFLISSWQGDALAVRGGPSRQSGGTGLDQQAAAAVGSAQTSGGWVLGCVLSNHCTEGDHAVAACVASLAVLLL